jgi:hypothetical protein
MLTYRSSGIGKIRDDVIYLSVSLIDQFSIVKLLETTLLHI